MPLLSRLTPNHWRLLKFCVVGTSGLLVNEAVLWLCQQVLYVGLDLDDTFLGGNRLTWSGATAIAVAILTNFLLNDRWTWGDREKKPGIRNFVLRLGKYYLIAAVAGTVQWLALKLLTEQAGLHYLASNVVGIVLGMMINFVANNAWTFRQTKRRPPG